MQIVLDVSCWLGVGVRAIFVRQRRVVCGGSTRRGRDCFEAPRMVRDDPMGVGISYERGTPVPLPSKQGTPQGLKDFHLHVKAMFKLRPGYEIDCLTCAMFARQR